MAIAIVRRQFITILAGVAAGPLADRVAPAGDPLWQRHRLSSAQVLCTPETRTFRHHGLAAELAIPLFTKSVIEAFAAGRMDIGFGNVLSIAGAINRGRNLVIVAPDATARNPRKLTTNIS